MDAEMDEDGFEKWQKRRRREKISEEEEEWEKYLNKPKCELEGRCVGSCHLVDHLRKLLGDFLYERYFKKYL